MTRVIPGSGYTRNTVTQQHLNRCQVAFPSTANMNECGLPAPISCPAEFIAPFAAYSLPIHSLCTPGSLPVHFLLTPLFTPCSLPVHCRGRTPHTPSVQSNSPIHQSNPSVSGPVSALPLVIGWKRSSLCFAGVDSSLDPNPFSNSSQMIRIYIRYHA
jgi:hypothetical protein